MILLDFISRNNITCCLSVSEYNRYLDYLDKLGIDSNLLELFSSIYKNDIDNITPLPYLDALYDINDDASLLSFYRNRTL